MSLPVFILGLQRSGTTWLGNLLAAHPDVAAAVHADHYGIHESVFFSHFARAWDWSTPEGRRSALRAFAASDYGRLIGADAERLALHTRPAEAFAAAMDAFAGHRPVWIEKSPCHTREARRIAEALPQARFVCLSRGSAAIASSRFTAYYRRPSKGLKRRTALFKAGASNAAHGRFVTAFAEEFGPRVLRLSYEDLKADTDAAMARVERFLGLDVRPLASAFVPNTSFTTDPRPVLTPDELRTIALGERAGRMVPPAVLTMPRRPVFPSWVWSPAERAQRTDVAIAPERRIET